MNAGPPGGAASARRTVVVANERGLHARAAAKFVELASRFRAEVVVERDGVEVSGLSIMGLMMFAAGPGSELVIRAAGPDARAAVLALAALVEAGFHES
ncbi:MAG: HPr family phosphocarrier protein [Alphaproteobacteria bacterium]